MTGLDYTILITYIGAIVFLGSVFSKGQTSLKEFFLASKNIPWWAAACSGIATMTSAISYLGGPGQAFKADFTFLQYRVATPLAIAIVCLVLVPLFYRLDLFSVYEYLERRFDSRVRILASGLFVLLKCFYLAIVIYASSLIVVEMTGLSLIWIIPMIGLTTTLYTMLGGMRAVIWTDTLQLVLLLGGLVAAFYMIVTQVDGGVAGVLQVANSQNKLRFFDFSFTILNTVTFWGGLMGGAFFMLSQYGVDQAELQRFLTTTSIRKSQLAMTSSMLFSTGLGFFQFFIGSSLFVFYSQFPEKGGLGINPDRVFPKFIIEELPTGLTGLLVAGVFAAAMSTISSVLNSLTTVSLSDIYGRITRRSASIRLARAVTIALGFLTAFLAFYADRLGTILEAGASITNLFGGTLVGVYLLGMWTRRANGTGAFVGALVGLIGVLLLSALTPVAWIWYAVFAATLSFGSGLLISLLFAPPPEQKMRGLVYGRAAKDDA